jgi:hypothetical protein
VRYYYKDFVTGKIRYTTGKFVGWSNPTGPVGGRYGVIMPMPKYKAIEEE